MAGEGFPVLRLEKHGKRLPHAGGEEGGLHLLRDGLRLTGAALLHGAGALLRHLVGGRAGAAGVGEDMHVGKAAAADELQRGGVVLLRLAGEARDKIAGQAAAGEVLAQKLHGAVKARGVVFAVHVFERPVAAGLKREVEVPAQPVRPGQTAAEVLAYDGRLERAEADAHVRRGGGAGGDNVGKAGAARKIDAVGGDLYPRQHELFEPLGVDARRFARGVLNGEAAQPPAGIGDDAVGAEVHAAVLNLQHGARPAGDRARRQALQLAALEGLVYIAAALAALHGLFHGLDQLRPVGRAEDDLRAEAFRLARLKLGIAAAHGQHRAGVLVAQAADELAGFAPALGSDGAGIDDDGVGKLAVGGAFMPALMQYGLHRLRLILVDLTAESGYNILHAKLLTYL